MRLISERLVVYFHFVSIYCFECNTIIDCWSNGVVGGEIVDALSALLGLPDRLGAEHTAAEIAQQPATWSGTLALCRQTELRAFVGGQAGSPVLLAGAGTSDFIGRSVERLLHRRWGAPVHAVASTELLTGMDDWLRTDEPALCISFSRSGDSSEGVAVIEEMRHRFPRVAHLVITCNAQGAMAKLMHGQAQSYALVLDPATNDRGLAMTSSFSNMVVAGQALAYLDDLDGYGVMLQQLMESAKSLLPRAADAAAGLAKRGFTRVCFLGSGALRATAAESALKVQELTAGRIFTMSESFLGLRHGPLSFIDKQTLVVASIASDAQTRSYESDLLQELHDKKLGATIAVTGFALTPKLLEAANVALDLGKGRPHTLPDALRPPLDVIFGQLLGLFFSLEAGLKPDTPSPSGAISRVVSHVKIHPSQPVLELK
jgi:tagatose-6-phosphate ketose/aldose isomerase